jgi:peptide/nickel transport system substrate-binding protein
MTFPALVFAAPQAGGTLNVVWMAMRTLNPAVQSGAATAAPGSQIFAGLVEMDANYQPQPYLATDWQVSPDGLTYTFHLVKGATFHDGKPITSADVAFSIMAVKQYHPFGPLMFSQVERVDTPDAHTAVIHLAHAAPQFFQALQPFLTPIMPKHVYGEGKLPANPHNTDAVVGSGPFQVAEYKPGQYLILKKYEGFFRKGRPYLDRIVFRISHDSLSSFLAFKKGDTDYSPFSPFQYRDLASLEADKSGMFHVTRDDYRAEGLVFYLELNLRKKPFDDVRVRRALQYAIDRKFLATRLLAGQAAPAESILATSNPYYDRSSLVTYPYDPEKAKRLLDEAGLKPGANGVRFSMTLDVAKWSEQVHVPMAEFIRAELKKIGVAVTLRSYPDFPSWAKAVASWDNDATTNGVWNYPDPTIGVHRLFACSNIRHLVWTNTEGYCSDKADMLMRGAASVSDLAERKKIYADFQHVLSEDEAVLMMLEGGYVTATHTYVKGLPKSVWGPLAPWDQVYLDKR